MPPPHWSVLTLAALGALAIAPPCLAAFHGAAWLAIGAGPAVWAASVSLKVLLVRVLERPLTRLPLLIGAGLHGLLSALCELGAAALALLWLAPLRLVDVVGFGIGAGSGEVIYILALAVIGPSPTAEVLALWMRGARVSLCVRYALPIERASASIGHLGSRGLIWLALAGHEGAVALALIAVVLFGAIDGIAVYGSRRRWSWHDPVICRRAQGAFAVLGAVELLLFVIAAAH